MRRARWLLPLLLAAAASTATAEHEIFYRYTVLGYVKDAAGQPRPGQRLELTRDKTGFSYLGESDAAGLFVIVARLGDESAGESLTLRMGRPDCNWWRASTRPTTPRSAVRGSTWRARRPWSGRPGSGRR